MRWILTAALFLLAFPARAETSYKWWEAAFYTTDPQAFTNVISASVALIAVGVSIWIGYNARNTAVSANQTAISALEAAKENTKTLFRIERPYITGGGDWDSTLTIG